MTYGERIRQVRIKRSLKLEELGQTIGVSASMMGHIEKNRREASVEQLAKIAQKLEVSTDFLVGHEDSEIEIDDALCRQAFRLFMRQFGDSLSTAIEADLKIALRFPKGPVTVAGWIAELNKVQYKEANSIKEQEPRR